MRCRRAGRLIGPFLDGELGETESFLLRRHLDTCPRCRERLASMRSLLNRLSGLKPLTPTPAESARLLAAIRREISSPAAQARQPSSTPMVRIAAVAVAAMTALGIGVTWFLVGGRPPTATQTEEAPGEVGQATKGEEGDFAAGSREEKEVSGPAGPETAMLVYPTVVAAGREYSSLELQGFDRDITPRLSFYSAYWHPLGEGLQAVQPSALREALLEEMAVRAARAGLDPEGLRVAVAAALEREGGEDLLPCYAEMARVDGKDAWLISLSGPEDYLLFSDPRLPAAMHLAARGGEEVLRLNESLLRELATRLTPYPSVKTPAMVDSGGSAGSQESSGTGGASSEDRQAGTDGGTEEEMMADFQAFLGELAARGTSTRLLAVLRDLNYDQLILLLQGDWAALAREGVDLTELLEPPSRLWVVDATTGEIIRKPR